MDRYRFCNAWTHNNPHNNNDDTASHKQSVIKNVQIDHKAG
jgi:hypothetical protein